MFKQIKNIIKFLLRKIFEILEIFFLRILNIKTFLKIILDNTYREYYINPKKDFKIKYNDGISGFYRVKNEENFIEKSVISHMPYLDEIIIVYNDCSDKTAEIAYKLSQKYPEKIKVYEYKPEVYPALSYKHMITPSKSVHSLANYYNFTLSKITKKIAVKIDADHIPIIENFKKATEKIRNINIKTMYYFYGVNIYIENNKNYINKIKPFTHGMDCGFFPISKKTYFINRKKSESLKLPTHMYFSRKSLGVLFYHIKGMKKYAANKNENDDEYLPENTKNIKIVYNPELITWIDAQKKYPEMLNGIPELIL